MDPGQDGSDPPTRDEVRAALARLVASAALRTAPQLVGFLTHVVERTLEGREGELKGYTIAVEALGRPTGFDPQTDPIVRVEAGRLRKALDLHYAGEGADDPVRIGVPRGGYVPVFWRRPEPAVDAVEAVEAGAAAGVPAREPPVDQASVVSPPRPARSRWPVLALGLAAALAAAAMALWSFGPGVTITIEPPPPVAIDRLFQEAARVSASTASAHLPVLAVGVVEGADDAQLAPHIQTYARHLIDAVARFDDLIIVRAPVTGSAPVTEGATYILELGASRTGDAAEGAGRLKSAADGRIVWSGAIAGDLRTGVDETALRDRARRLAIRLAQPFGILHADLRLQAATPEMTCIFVALNYRRNMGAADHLAARTCLETVLERDPGFHPAWSQLALITLDEYRLGHNARPGPALDRALNAALTAARLAPASARAQQALMGALFARGEHEEALRAGAEALARNPNDPDILADLGARHVMLNQPERGLPLLLRATKLSTGRPAWYDFHLFLAAHLTGAGALAQTHARYLGADDTTLSLIGRVLEAGAEQDRATAAPIIRRLLAAEPALRRDASAHLARRGFVPEVANRIMADMRRIGFDEIAAEARP